MIVRIDEIQVGDVVFSERGPRTVISAGPDTSDRHYTCIVFEHADICANSTLIAPNDYELEIVDRN